MLLYDGKIFLHLFVMVEGAELIGVNAVLQSGFNDRSKK